MRKVCLLNRGFVRLEITRGYNKNYMLTKEESIYAITIRKDSQRCIRLHCKKLKCVKFRILAKRNLNYRYDDRFSWNSSVVCNISKN